jgi:hypothetical protein
MFGPLLLIAALALMFTAGAQAVHDIGAFELDGNAADNPAGGADDWNNVYQQITLDTNDTGADDQCTALGAVECAFTSDPDGHSIFTTGGSKDDLDIPSWRHKDGNVPPKDEILNAYAAKYISTDAESLGDEILYFGADRFAQNGSADFGFWFFRNAVGENADGTFSGSHVGTLATPGDILILGTFTQGGATSNIRVFEWVGTGGNATSNGTVEGPTGAFGDCGAAASDDEGCGIVNSQLIPVAWPYTPSQGDSGSIPPGGFVEGGINLSEIGLAGCFRSFLAETRSSPSVDATLKDYVLGNFEPCEANIVTTPSSATVAPGEQVQDSATITASGGGPATGTVNFFLCAKDVEPCATGGTAVGSVSLAGNTLNPVTVTSNFVNTAASPLEPGRYCFAAEWADDPNYADDSDRTTGECFTVRTIPTAISTSQSVYPNDSATISTATGVLPAGGTVLFKAYIATTGVTALDNCTANGATGLLYSETSTALTGGSASETKSTANTTNAIPPGTTVYWRVLYTSNSGTYESRQSVCVENTIVTFNNDSGPGTKP